MFSNRSLRLAVKARIWNPSEVDWKLASQCVQMEEKTRIGNFVFKRDAKMAMVGRLLLRYGVSKILEVPSRCLSFGRSDKGKPYLLSPIDKVSRRCDVNFNISHQGDYVVFASDKDRLVGIDVMKVEWPRNKPISEFFVNMKRQLTQHEWSEVNKRSGDMEQLKTFYRLWCLKESLVKALGTGIGFEVGRLDFHFDTPELRTGCTVTDTKVRIDGLSAACWRFEETMLEDHCVAVAVRTDANTDSCDKDKECSDDGNVPIPPSSFTVLDALDLLSYCDPLVGSAPDTEFWEKFDGRQEDPTSAR